MSRGSVHAAVLIASAGAFAEGGQLWATVCFAVLASIVIHCVSASPVLRTLDRRFGRRTPDPA